MGKFAYSKKELEVWKNLPIGWIMGNSGRWRPDEATRVAGKFAYKRELARSMRNFAYRVWERKTERGSRSRSDEFVNRQNAQKNRPITGRFCKFF